MKNSGTILSRAAIDAALEIAFDPMLILDKQSKTIVGANAVCMKLLKLQDGTLIIGRSLDELCTTETAQLVQDLSEPALLEPGEHWETEVELLNRDKEAVRVVVSLRTIESDSGELYCVRFQETQPKFAATQQTVGADGFTEAPTVVSSEFVEQLSHTVRTPMTAVLGAAQLLSLSDLDDEQHELVAMMIGSGEALIASMNSLLDQAYIDSGKVVLDKVEFDITSVVRQAAILFGNSAFEKGLVIETRLMTPVPLVLIGDEKRIAQILNNLINDAIRSTSRGRIILQLELVTEHESSMTVRISVTDTVATKGVFEDPFAAQSPNNSGLFAGAKSGLSGLRSLVVQMGGRMGVGTDGGHSRAIWFEISLQRPEVAPKVEASPISYKVTSNRQRVVRMRSLLVDDNHLNLQMMRKVLESHGFEVDLARDGTEAVALFEQHEYDIIFMDLHMPKMDGYEASKRIRELEHSDDVTVPIVALTADVRKDIEERCLESGMTEFLMKPFGLKELQDLIDQLLNEKGCLSSVS